MDLIGRRPVADFGRFEEMLRRPAEAKIFAAFCSTLSLEGVLFRPSARRRSQLPRSWKSRVNRHRLRSALLTLRPRFPTPSCLRTGPRFHEGIRPCGPSGECPMCQLRAGRAHRRVRAPDHQQGRAGSRFAFRRGAASVRGHTLRRQVWPRERRRFPGEHLLA